jgi:hypothetical protein
LAFVVILFSVWAVAPCDGAVALGALGQFLASHGYSSAQLVHPGNSYRLPINSNGKAGNLLVDTGASLRNALSQTEIDSLGKERRCCSHGALSPCFCVCQSRRPDRAGRLQDVQNGDFTTPPSTRKAAPFVAAASGLHTNATIGATSSGLAKRLSSEVGRAVLKNSSSNSSRL